MKEKRKNQEKSRPSGSFAREISLWALLARGSIYKILTILLLMVPVEGVLFYRALEERAEWTSDVDYLIFENTRFDSIFAYSKIDGVFLAAFCLVTFVLVWSQSETCGTKSGYTLRRLRVTGKHLFWVTAGYNFLCFVLLFAVQIWAGLWMCRLYRERMPAELVPSQLEFLAFYRTRLLHNLLPLADVEKWVMVLLMLLAMSVTVAERSLAHQWRQVWPLSLYLCVGTLWMASGGIGIQGVNVVGYMGFVVLIAVSVLRGIGVLGTDKSVREPQ